MSELFGIHGLVVAIVALLVIGPKDLPKAMRAAGYWVGKARGISRQFRQGFDNMVREAEIEEMEKKWAAENERIMREHPTATDPAPPSDDDADRPVMVEKPVVQSAPEAATADQGALPLSAGQPTSVEKPSVEQPATPSTSAPKPDATPS